jgi:multiple antibiotic resistance protein
MIVIPLLPAVLLAYAGPVIAADGPSAALTLELGKVFTFFLLTLGPKNVIGPFARKTRPLDVGGRRRVALIATGISLLSVLIASTIGVRVLEGWGISSGALLIAAGTILFLVALDAIRDRYEPGATQARQEPEVRPARQLAFEIAFPYIVSPYGVAVVILVLSTRPDAVSVIPIVAMLGGIMLLNLLAMLNADRFVRSTYVAPAMAIIGSVLAVLQAALGIQAVLIGLRLAGVF